MGKFWQAIEVKAIGEKKFGKEATVSTCMPNTFSVYLNIGKDDVGE